MGFIKFVLGLVAYSGTLLFGLSAVVLLFDGTLEFTSKAMSTPIAFGIAFGFAKLGKWLMKTPQPTVEPARSNTSPSLDSDSLQELFYQLVRTNNGSITVMRFAMETGLSGKDAQAYLDEKAKEFNAHYDIDSRGNITYQFPV
ncbi:hypothetical protein [Baaleninema sp.]|uniref:hypothetical protein n=1 Tax=Baaleninema sp. TaxID=3101197 RepID=UPI003CFFFA65